MFCPKCGSDVRSGMSFCEKCGAKLNVATQQSNMQQNGAQQSDVGANSSQTVQAQQGSAQTNAAMGTGTESKSAKIIIAFRIAYGVILAIWSLVLVVGMQDVTDSMRLKRFLISLTCLVTVESLAAIIAAFVMRQGKKVLIRKIGSMLICMLVLGFAWNYIGNLSEKVINTVKAGYLDEKNSITYGVAIENFLSDPEWSFFNSDTQKIVVETTGGCTYNGKDAKMLIQFIFDEAVEPDSITKDSKFYMHYMEVDGKACSDDEIDSALSSMLEASLDVIKIIRGETSEDEDSSAVDESSQSEDSSEDIIDDTSSIEDDSTNVEDTSEDISEENEDDTRYIIPNSDSKKLTKADIKGLSKEKLRLARNEIYARHGRIFSDQKLQNYFDKQDWYVGVIEPEDFVDTEKLSALERKNVSFLAKHE